MEIKFAIYVKLKWIAPGKKKRQPDDQTSYQGWMDKVKSLFHIKHSNTQSFHNNNFQCELLNVASICLQKDKRWRNSHPALKTDSSAKYINHSKTRNESFAVDLWIYPSAADLPPNRCGRKDDRKEGRTTYNCRWTCNVITKASTVSWIAVVRFYVLLLLLPFILGICHLRESSS